MILIGHKPISQTCAAVQLCEELIRCQKRTLRAYRAFKKARELEIKAAEAVRRSRSESPSRL